MSILLEADLQAAISVRPEELARGRLHGCGGLLGLPDGDCDPRDRRRVAIRPRGLHEVGVLRRLVVEDLARELLLLDDGGRRTRGASPSSPELLVEP
eukprot:16437987-Heterocapsa_arctica.AAC.1